MKLHISYVLLVYICETSNLLFTIPLDVPDISYYYLIGYLWGIGCGGLMMAHKVRLYRKCYVTTSVVKYSVCNVNS